ncbi:MAG: gamma-glutamyltransferase [Planctomycetaceae bacterium]|nr:gamma-glutamyltransferase [Planctomycetaceae bacterium]
MIVQHTCFFLLFLFVLSGMLWAQDRRSGQPWTTRSEVIAQNGMVCSSHPLATQIGIDVLKKGGNAIDAAIAVNAALGLMEPTGCGIGGDFFAIVWDAKTQKLYGLNGSGAAPKNLTPAVFNELGLEQIPTYGPLSVSVPGCVDGWFELHKRFGSLPMMDILQPTIEYANNGFPLTEIIVNEFRGDIERHADYRNVKETFAPNGEIWQRGDVYRNPMLAKTLALIAEKGRDEFYKGSIARTITDFMQSQGGYLTLEDLASHTSEWVDLVSTNYRGYDVWAIPPNGQGITVLQMLNLLELYDVKSFGFGSADHIHFLVEAKKLAFEDRAKYYADMRFADVPVQQLISKEYAKLRSAEIDPARASIAPQPGAIAGNDTVYLTIADKDGNMVSLIQSNYWGLGSGMVPPGLGFMLHNRGQSFSLIEGHANVLAPGKRPFHTIIPGFITKDGKPFVSFGVMGGDFQPQGQVQIVLNLIDFSMNLQEAGDAPRVQHTGSSHFRGEPASGGGQVVLENGFSPTVQRQLLQRGHSVAFGFGATYGGYQAIMVDVERGVYFGASDSRKDGCAMGY